MTNDLAPIQNMIYEVRGQKIMLDSDLALLYGVETRTLNQAVKRNAMRFPQDFMFKLTEDELESLRFQFGTSNLTSQFVTSSWGGKRKLPHVFTEQGIAMLSSVLKSDRAIAINIQIMRMFVKMRYLTIEHKDLKERIQDLEQYLIHYAQDTNTEIDKINQAIDLLMDRTRPARIGFKE
jgi:hypothetical protein